MILELTIDGEPVPKGRPRINRQTGTVYTPRETRQYEALVSMVALSKHVSFSTQPVRVDLWIYTGKKKVDSDNVLKSVLDALQVAQVFDNDSQVTEHHVYRVSSPRPRVEITVRATEERTET